MSRLQWDASGAKHYETGVDQGVLYPYDNGAPGTGVAWNGLTAITQSPSGAEATAIYADNIKYLTLRSVEEFGGTIEAYMYPDEWAECDGSVEPANATGVKFGQQARKVFGLCYRTKIGNDVDLDDHGYKIHLVYGATASPSEMNYQTVNDSPEAASLSWEFETNPVAVAGYKPVSHIEIDSTKANAAKLAALEKLLYGVDAPAFDATKTYAVGDFCTHENATYRCTTAITVAAAWDASKWTAESVLPRLPMPSEIITLMAVSQ